MTRHADELESRPSATRRRRGAWAWITAVVVLAGALGVGAVLALRPHRSAPVISARSRSATAASTTQPSPSATTSPSSPVTTSATPPSFADLYASGRTGIVRIRSVTCDGGGVGTGFLIAPTEVATAAHVVDLSVAVSITDTRGNTHTGKVVGLDRSEDVALVRLARPIHGHVFALSGTEPRVGDRVAAIGFPLAGPLSMTQGSVSGLHRKVSAGEQDSSGPIYHSSDAIQTDTPVNPGNSGGPLLMADGTVAGIVESTKPDTQGLNYADDVQRVAAILTGWQTSAQPVPPARCSDALGPGGPTLGGSGTENAAQDEALATLQTYFDAINSGDYATAYGQLAPTLHRGSLAGYAKGLQTTYDSGFTVNAVTGPAADGSVRVWLTFTSLQAPDKGPNGESCDVWSLDYQLVRVGGALLIGSVSGHGGGTPYKSCD